MLKIRLARVGKRGHATFRVAVTEHTRPPKSGALEQIGSYDPHANTLHVNAERLKARLAQGAKLSPTLQNLLVEHKILEGEKLRVWKPKRKAGDTAAATGAPAGSSEAPTVEDPKGEAPPSPGTPSST